MAVCDASDGCTFVQEQFAVVVAAVVAVVVVVGMAEVDFFFGLQSLLCDAASRSSRPASRRGRACFANTVEEAAAASEFGVGSRNSSIRKHILKRNDAINDASNKRKSPNYRVVTRAIDQCSMISRNYFIIKEMYVI